LPRTKKAANGFKLEIFCDNEYFVVMSDKLSTNRNENTEPKSTLSLSGNTEKLDLSLLSPEAQEEVRKAQALGMVEMQLKAQKMGLETLELDQNLKNIEATVADASRNGAHAQVTKTQNNSLGRTEVIIGNTDNAAKGKFTKTQSGEKDNTMVYILVGFAALVVIILLLK
jgi:hypothetical protein